MTLVISVVSPKVIYQSADYRLTDWRTGSIDDFKSQKVFVVSGTEWNASVAFTGIGHTGRMDVGEWVSDALGGPWGRSSIDQLYEKLQSANDWLRPIQEERRHHSFIVCAFVGAAAQLALISNCQSLQGPSITTPREFLTLEVIEPESPRTFVFGAGRTDLRRQQRRRLSLLVARDPKPELVYEALRRTNASVAQLNRTVSQSCSTTHVRRTGESGGVQGDGGRRTLSISPIPGPLREAVSELLSSQLPDGYRMQAVSSIRYPASEESHRVQLLDKPNDPDAHNNYGVFLKDSKHDAAGAEREYRAALALAESHAKALGNLANLLWEKGTMNEARDKYMRALLADQSGAVNRTNFVRFLIEVDNDLSQAESVIEDGLALEPLNEQLLVQWMDVAGRKKDYTSALDRARQIRERFSGSSEVECGYAIYFHIAAGASAVECIENYRVALAVNKGHAVLLLNLAQLLFLVGAHEEGLVRLHEAERAGLDADGMLEVEFYKLAYSSEPRLDVLARIASLVDNGATTEWNFEPTIAHVRSTDPNRADLLQDLAIALIGREPWSSVGPPLIAKSSC